MKLFAFITWVACAAFGADARAQSVLWNRFVQGPAGQAVSLGDGYVITRSMAVDRSGNVVITGSTANATNRDFVTTKVGASGTVAWQKVFAGSANRDDDALSVAVDASGNALVVGISIGAGTSDIKVVKYAAADGAVLWERSIDAGLNEAGYFIAVDAAGNAIVGGEAFNAAGHWDVRVVKLAAATGATIWDQTSDTGKDDFVSDIAVDASGNVLVLGVAVNAAGNDDVRVLKLAGASGTLLWQQTFDWGGDDEAFALALDAADNVFLTGTAVAAQNANIRTMKLAAATGATLWQQTYDGGREDHAQAVALDSAGNALVAGQSQNAAGRFVFRTLKYSAASGAPLWEATFDGGVNDYAYQVAVDAADNAVVVGGTTNAAGNTDWKTIVYAKADGAVLMQHSHAGSAGLNDDAYAVAADSSGIIVGGSSMESGAPAGVRLIKLASPTSTPTPAPPAPPAPGPSGNVALASSGAVATASSSYGSTTPAGAVIDNDRTGAGWGNGGGWEDATHNAFPDWVQVVFNGPKTIDRVVVYTLRDDIGNRSEPTDTLTFSAYGITDFTVQGWNGSSWVTLGTVAANNLVKRTVDFAAFTTDRIRVNVTAARYFKSRIVEIEAFGTAASTGQAPANVALASVGAVASASSTYGSSAPVSALIDNERAGARWGSGGGWEDATHNAYPDWVQVDFNGAKSIDRVVVYTLRDDIGNPADPSDTATFAAYGVTDFTVQGWNGSSWVTLATVAGNRLVKRTVTFASFTTDRIRVHITGSLYFKSRLVEIEAWGVPATAAASNVALASAGAAATASSTYGPTAPASAVIDNQRSGSTWGSGGGWEDATHDAYPDWVQVTFNGTKKIDRVVVYTLRDDIGNPAEPTDATTFAVYGVTDFAVQGWNGSAWITLGSVAGNNLVKRAVSFSPFTTDRIRVNVTRALYFKSRIVEVEAWGAPAS